MSPESERVPIFLCCAEENEVALVGAVRALRAQGLEPELIPGVELDAGLLADVVDKNLGAGLYVLCQSEELDRFQIRRLEGIFSARKGPAHKLAIVELDVEYPLAIVPEIAETVDAFEGGELNRASKVEDAPDAGNLRDVVGPGYTGEKQRRAATRRQPKRPKREPPKPPPIPVRTPAHRRPVSYARDRDEPVRREAADTARIPSGQERPREVATAHEVAAAREEPATEKIVPPPAAAVATPPEAAPVMAPVRPPRSPFRGAAIAWMGLGGLIVLIAAGIVLMRDRGSLGEDTKEPASARSAAKPPPAPAQAPTAATSTGETGGQTDAAQTEPKPDEPSAAVRQLDEPPPAPDPSRPGPDEDALTAAAIAEGKIRALDLLLIVPPRTERVVPWHEAANHCKAAVVAGVRRFRLPTIKELKKVRRARMLPKGAYWTGTLVSSDQESVYVLDTALRGVAPWHKSEEATPLCVRTK